MPRTVAGRLRYSAEAWILTPKAPEIAPDKRTMWLARNLTFSECMKAGFRFVLVVLGPSIVAITAVGGFGCVGRNGTGTSGDPLARGKQIVQRTSDALSQAQTFSVVTHEVRDAVQSDGKVVHLSLDHKVTLRRPDRLYVETTGDRRNEVWYDGNGITVVMHGEKVFAQARMPETLDRTLDALQERYGFYVPGSDTLYSNPAHALLTDTTTGGWVGVETIDEQACDHVAFEDRGVKWELWVPTTGTSLPRRSKAEFPHQKRLRKFQIDFTNWNLSPTIAADVFAPVVPTGYEGIAMIQRAAVLANISEQTPPTEQKK